jgi:hypothetical protein
MLGYPDAALTDAAQALKDARKIGHAAVLMHALGHTPRIYAQCGNYAAASALANELISLADEKGALEVGRNDIPGWAFCLDGESRRSS